MNNKISVETKEQAVKVARGTQKIGQTKEQTKLIAQGIEKGIAEYKKQQSKKLREKDKQRKKMVKTKLEQSPEITQEKSEHSVVKLLPWGLLALSWLGFFIYISMY